MDETELKQLLKECTDEPPEDFVGLIADAMIAWGPDGHCDGHETIAKLAWNKARETPC